MNNDNIIPFKLGVIMFLATDPETGELLRNPNPSSPKFGVPTTAVEMEEGRFENSSVGQLMVDYPSYFSTELSPAEEFKLKDLMTRIRHHIKRDK